MKATIQVEKIMHKGIACYEILGFEGVERACDLPYEYLRSDKTRFYLESNRTTVALWMAEGEYLPEMACPEVNKPAYTNNVYLTVGAKWAMVDLDRYVDILRVAGERLSQINQRTRSIGVSWSGPAVIEI